MQGDQLPRISGTTADSATVLSTWWRTVSSNCEPVLILSTVWCFVRVTKRINLYRPTNGKISLSRIYPSTSSLLKHCYISWYLGILMTTKVVIGILRRGSGYKVPFPAEEVLAFCWCWEKESQFSLLLCHLMYWPHSKVSHTLRRGHEVGWVRRLAPKGSSPVNETITKV